MGNKTSLIEKISKIGSKIIISPIASLFFVILTILMLIIPLPVLALDILIAVNLLLAITIFIKAIYSKEAADFSLLPTVLFVMTIFGLALNVAATRIILTKGTDFDGRLILFISSLLVSSVENIQLAVGFALFIMLAYIMLVIAKVTYRAAKDASQSSLDYMEEKYKVVETEYSSGEISKEEAALVKEDIYRESIFYGFLKGPCKFILNIEKCKLFIAVITILGGLFIHSFAGPFFLDGFPDGRCDIPSFFIGTVFFKEGIPEGSALGMLFNSEQLKEAVKIYVPLAIGSGVLAMLPSLLLSVAVGLVVTRRARE